jgi:hypothetical protein
MIISNNKQQIEGDVMQDNIFKNKLGLTEEQFLSTYDASKLRDLRWTVDMLIFTGLMKKRKTIGGFLKNILRTPND